MTEITTDSPELAQAKLATFAAEYVKDWGDRCHILNNLGSLALNNPADISRTTETIEYSTDKDGAPIQIPEGTEKFIASASDYAEFLRSVGGPEYEFIRQRADMLRAYGPFASAIDQLREELSDNATCEQHPAFLGRGSNSVVAYIVEAGHEYAVRIPVGEQPQPQRIDDHVAGAILGKGIPHLEQIVAASYEKGVTVAEIMPGKELGMLSVEQLRNITDEQLDQLVGTLVEANARGIGIDPKPSNILYDTDEGFGIVDYMPYTDAKNKPARQDLGEVIGWIGNGSLLNAGLYGRGYKTVKTLDDYANILGIHIVNFDTLKLYIGAVERSLTGDVRETALAALEVGIRNVEQAINDHSSVEWVAASIARDEDWERRRTARTGSQTATLGGWEYV